MCNIITYGFTKNNGARLGAACNATTSDILGAVVQVSFGPTEMGMTVVAKVRLLYNGINKGLFLSPEYTVNSSTPSIKIPFTGLTTEVGIYTFGDDNCATINSPDLSSQYCIACTSTGCVSLSVTVLCTIPTCDFALA